MTRRELCAWAIAGVTSLATYGAAAADTSLARFEGAWVSTLTHVDDPRWTLLDVVCPYCAEPTLDYLTALLAAPTEKVPRSKELEALARQKNREVLDSLLTERARTQKAQYKPTDDPVLKCQPVGLFRVIDGILPVKIRVEGREIVFNYEYFNSQRRIALDAPAVDGGQPTRLGRSVGWLDGQTLVVRTNTLAPNLFGNVQYEGQSHTARAEAIERYSVSADGQRIDYAYTIVDPWTLKRPLTFRKSWLKIPDLELETFECDPEEAASSP